jgi:predicted aminopeptidase
MSGWLRAWAAGALVASTAGCGAPYLLRAAYEEARILLRREPITEMLARGDLEAPMREKLRLVLAVRRFAADAIGFAVGESFATFARVDGDAVAYVVTAAYRDRLQAYAWRYPIVGRVPYRGFFARARAERYAARLEQRDLDTAVWATTAFSTLGWFEDPLLSSMLGEDTVELASTVFHELAHAFLYVPSAAAFNESFASFVGHRAAIAFFCGQREAAADSGNAAPSRDPRPTADCVLAEARWHDECAYAAVLAQVADALTALYAAAPTAASGEARRQILAAASGTLARQPLRTERYRGRDLTGFNNAVLVQQLLYRSGLTRFEAVWRAAHGDLRRTVAGIATAVKGSEEPFAELDRLAAAQGRSSVSTPGGEGRKGREGKKE